MTKEKARELLLGMHQAAKGEIRKEHLQEAANELHKEGTLSKEDLEKIVGGGLHLFGLASSDLVMTGGGPGADSTAYSFSSENPPEKE